MAKQKWILLTHQLTPKPSNVRVKVWRRLQSLGSIAVKNSIYILPNNPETREDFEWLRKEIKQMKGDASIFLANSINNVEDKEIIEAFQRARTGDFDQLIKESSELKDKIKGLLGVGHVKAELIERQSKEWDTLKNDLRHLQKVDFFRAPNRLKAESLASEIQKLFDQAKTVSLKELPSPPPPANPENLKNHKWVTRKSPRVDRLACAWLIRQHIDSKARFKFVSEPYKPSHSKEIRFDMYDAEFTHYGDWCSFETFMHRLNLKDPTLHEIAEIVHDIDLKDGKFERSEAGGVGEVISGICELYRNDRERLEAGIQIFDALYSALSNKGGRKK